MVVIHLVRTNTTPRPPPPAFVSGISFLFCVAQRQTSAVDMMNVDGAGTSSAKRKTGTTAALDVSARAADRRNGARCGPASQP